MIYSSPVLLLYILRLSIKKKNMCVCYHKICLSIIKYIYMCGSYSE